MKLFKGDQIGSYTIEAMIGFGGMGHVYGGRHTQLERAVAIKVLPEELSRDSVALQRFRREALSASRLSHPHICTIYDFIEDRGASFLVMEYLDGETLADRIAKAPLEEPEIVEIAVQIANALAHAHGKGIVHRDLKPANVMLTPSGVKVLDFGLAKDTTHIGVAIAAEGSTAAIDTYATSASRIAGTPPYMAPEAVDGRVDARSDVYALGVMIFEMVTGRLPYSGQSVEELIAATVVGQPDPFASVGDGSSRLMKIARRCMALRPADRWSSATEAATALRSARSRTTWLRPARTHSANRLIEFALVGAAAIGLAAIAMVIYSATRAPGPRAEALTFDLQPPAGVALSEVFIDAALSPDGRTVLFSGSDSVGGLHLWTRSVTTSTAGMLPNTEGAHTPFWSPDGARLGYFARGSMWISDLSGSRPQRLAPVSLEVRGGSWGPTDQIIYSPGQNQGLLRLSLATGVIDTISNPDRAAGQIGHLWPHFLPDGKHFLYFVAADNDSAQGIYLGSTDEPGARRLVYASGNALFANGNLLFFREGDVLAQSLDASDLVLAGRAVALVRDVAASYTYQAAFSVSNTGVLVYSAASTKSQSRMVSVDAAGNPLAFLSPSQHQRNPAISFDGSRLAFELYEGTDSDIAVLDLASGRVQRLSDRAMQARNPIWSPTGYEIAYVTEEARGWALYRWDPDSGAPPRRVFLSSDAIQPSDWSTDNQMLLARRDDKGYDVVILQLQGDGELKPLLAENGHQLSAVWSRDHSQIAYESSSAEGIDVFLTDYPPTGHHCQISTNGGFAPQWGMNDSTLFFVDPGGVLMKASISDRNRCPRNAPVALMRPGMTDPAAAAITYAVHPVNGTFLFNLPDANGKPPIISAIVNWGNRLATGNR